MMIIINQMMILPSTMVNEYHFFHQIQYVIQENQIESMK